MKKYYLFFIIAILISSLNIAAIASDDLNPLDPESIGLNSVMADTIECVASFGTEIDGVNYIAWFGNTSTGSPTSYFWDFGDGETSKDSDPQHTYPKEGIYTVCLSVYKSTNQSFSKYCEQITVGNPNTSSCYVDFSTEQGNLTVSFFENISPDITSVFWDFGDGNSSYIHNPVHTYEKSGIYDICLYVSDSLTGCKNEMCTKLSIGTIECQAGFEVMIDNQSKKVEFINTSIGDFSKYYWDLGDGTSTYNKSTSKLYDNFGFYKVCLSAYSESTSCFSEKCKIIEIIDTNNLVYCRPRFSYVVSDTTRIVKFSENSLVSFDKWYWNFGDGNMSVLKSPIHRFERDGVYNVCLSVASIKNNCTASICRDVSVSSNTNEPVLKAGFGQMIDSIGLGVLFKDNSIGNPTNWYWTFGDGTYSKEQNPAKHIYGSAGIYPVCLTIINAKTDASSLFCNKITVGELGCNIISDFVEFIDVNNLSVKFKDASKGKIDNWFWNFGDGNTSRAQNPIHQYRNKGFYLVSLSVRNTEVGCTDYYSQFIQVGDMACKANFLYSIDIDRNTVTFESTSKGDIEKYYWAFDDGTFDYGQKVTHQYKNPGMYSAGLTISTLKGICRDHIVKPVQLGKVNCNADFNLFVDSLKKTAYFKNQVIGSLTKLFWQFGDGAVSSDENPVHAYTQPGYYTVGLNTYDSKNNCMDYNEKVVMISKSGIDCEADFYYQVDGLTVQYYDNSKGEDLSYFWSFDDGETAKFANPSKTYFDGGYYPACLTIYTPDGIQNTRCKAVSVDPPANKDCSADFTYFVDKDNLTVTCFDKSVGDVDAWLWKYENGITFNVQNPSYTFNEAGFYKVRLVSGNITTGCRSRAWQMIDVGMNKTGFKAGFGYEIDPLKLKTGGYPVDFVGISSGKPARYIWDFGDGEQDSINISPTHEYEFTGTYNVCLTVEDQVTQETDQACEDVDVYEVGIYNNISDPAGISLNNYPNPFTSYTSIEYIIPIKTNVIINIYDEEGKIVENITNTEKNKGKHTILWNANRFHKGIYFIQLKTGYNFNTTKMIVKE